MTLKAENILRRVIYQRVKEANANEQTEIAYDTFGDYEIATIHTKSQRDILSGKALPKTIKTYKWFGNCRTEVLEEYESLEDAIEGHKKWCQKEFAV